MDITTETGTENVYVICNRCNTRKTIRPATNEPGNDSKI